MDWQSSSTEILLNPRLPQQEQQLLCDTLHAFNLKAHVWLATSGSTSRANEGGKWVALSKEAILASAYAVNQHLQSDSSDIWLNPLPDFHVGGLGIWARSYLSGAKCIDYTQASLSKWNPVECYQTLVESRATLTAMVSAQLYDLVRLELRSPATLRALIIGGGALQPALYAKAIELGWTVLPSYGLTECASQVATASLIQNSGDTKESLPPLQLLPHLQAVITPTGLIGLKGNAVLTAYAVSTQVGMQLIDPKQDGWFYTEDRGILTGNTLQILGRSEGFLKIGGESVEMKRLEGIFEELRLELKISCDVALIAFPDERLGSVIHLVATESNSTIEECMQRYAARVLPFERIRELHVVEEIPRTALNKLRKEEVLQLIKSRSAPVPL